MEVNTSESNEQNRQVALMKLLESICRKQFWSDVELIGDMLLFDTEEMRNTYKMIVFNHINKCDSLKKHWYKVDASLGGHYIKYDPNVKKLKE